MLWYHKNQRELSLEGYLATVLPTQIRVNLERKVTIQRHQVQLMFESLKII